jgi:hypothetical protein
MATSAAASYPCHLVTDKERPLADPGAEWWTTEDIAAYLGVSAATVRRYRSRDLPPEDHTFLRTLVWRPATITAWERPGRGARTDLRQDAES